MGNSTGKTSHDYEEEKVLGQGAFGKVKLVHPKGEPSNKCALKKIKYGGIFSASTKDMIAHEISVQQKFDHQNVAKLLDFWYEPGNLYGGKGYMLLEFCENGSARQFAPHETKYSFGDAFKHMSICWKFTEEMISALVYVHNRDVIHRDLKLDNVLIHADGRFKLTDFGLSTGRHEELQKLRDASLEPAVFDETHLSKIETLRTNSQCGTMLYMAPEIFSGGTYGKAVDLYALGLAVREMLAHHSIATFQDVNVRHLVYNGEPIVPPASEILCLLICAAPLVAHRHLYAFLAVHTVLFILSSLFMRRLILLRIANCMTSKDPAARLTSAQHLQYMSNSKVVVEVVYPVLFAAVVLLYPFDMRGNVAASLLLDCIFIVHLVFSLVWYPSLLLTAAAVERAKLQ